MNKSLLTNLFSLFLIAISFVTPIYSSELRTMGLYSFSGAITNWLAIHMLFEKIPFLYGSGIITERFEDFKQGINELVMTQFFTKDNLNRFLSEQNTSPINTDILISAIDFDDVFIKLKGAILDSPFGGMLNMFGGEQALEPLKPQFEEKFKEIIVDISKSEKFQNSLSKSSMSETLLEKIEIIVRERLSELTPQMVKEIIQKMIKEHLGWLVVWGGVFGALIGFVTTFF